MKQKIVIEKLIPHFVKSLIVLIIAGIIIDLFLNQIPEEGTFKLAIKLSKLAAPGVEDIAKLALDVIYAFIYSVLRTR